MQGTLYCLGTPKLEVPQICILLAMRLTDRIPFPQVAAAVQTHLVVVYAPEEGQYFMACPDGDPA